MSLVITLGTGPAIPAQAHTTSVQARAAAKLTIGMPTAYRSAGNAHRALAKLTVAASGSMKGYSRTKFPHWLDASTWGWPKAPNNRCNTRNAALYRDGVGVTMSKNCTYLRGSWLDPYTATWYYQASDIDIDHVVPLAEAWRSGASRWTTRQRTAYANNPLEVVSVEDNANQAKSDKDPARWKPQNKAAYCRYAERWIAVKATYRLTVDPAEKSALVTMLKTC